jgi:hypothetical protein
MPEQLLNFGAIAEFAGTAKRFAAQDRFVVNMAPGTPVLISYVLGNFERWFHDKVEEPVSAASIEWHELQRNANDEELLAALGGAARAETTLSEVFAFMERQGKGQAGFLATNGWGNIFYVRDAGGELRAVDVHWCDDGWNVEAGRIGRNMEWPIRDRVYRRAG